MTENTAEITRQVTSALSRLQVSSDSPIVIALSGGVDSQVLAHALMAVAGETGNRLHAVHVDHGLREASADDARSVVGICRGWELPCDVAHVDVGSWDDVLQQGTESAARAARYAALAHAADQSGGHIVATGHTQDDQVETILLRLIAGSGLQGLGGISQISRREVRLEPERSGTKTITLVRPLLNCTRQAIEQYAREHGLTPIEDDTNQLTSFRRNAIRLNVVPALEDIEPAARQAIARTATLLREDAEFVNDLVDDLCADLVAERSGVWMIERQQFRDAHQALQRRVLYRVIEPLISPSARIGQERIEALREATVSGRPGKKIELADDLLGYVDYDRLAIGRAGTLESDLRRLSWVPLIEPGTELPIAGEVEISLDNGWRILGEAPAQSGLALRTRRDGDRVRGTRGRPIKLQDWLVDRKVPRYVRDWLPVVADDDQIKWIIGLDMTEFSDTRSDVHLYLELDAGASMAQG